MKIDPNLAAAVNLQSDSVQGSKTARTQQSTSDTGTASQLDGTDTVQVSPKFAEVQQLTSQLQQLPNIRSDRVAALRQQIQQGTYNPDPTDVADAILNDPFNRAGQS